MIKVADITPYIYAHVGDVIDQYAKEKEDYDLDIAGCSIFEGGDTVISMLENKGYVIIDSANKMRNDILESNRNLPTNFTTQPIDVAPKDFTELKNMVKILNGDYIYSCESTSTFSVVLFCQIFRPTIKWTINPGLSVEYANYCRNMLYTRNTVYNLAQFMQILSCEDKFDLFYYNNFYTLEKPNEFSLEDTYKLPSRLETLTWAEIASTEIILPHSLGIESHRPESNNDVWKIVVDNIIMSLSKPKVTSRDLKEFLKGGSYE